MKKVIPSKHDLLDFNIIYVDARLENATSDDNHDPKGNLLSKARMKIPILISYDNFIVIPLNKNLARMMAILVNLFGVVRRDLTNYLKTSLDLFVVPPYEMLDNDPNIVCNQLNINHCI